MMLRLILGRAGSGKSRLCLQEINDRLEKDPFSPSLIYLIPRQASFQAEYRLANFTPQGGSIRAQALSFKRLAWKVMQETGAKGHLFVDDTGKKMIMLKLLQENKDKLRLFRHAGEQPGTLAHLVQFYSEMKRYCLTSATLKEVLGEEKGEMPLLLQDKLADLALIMKEMEHNMEGHYLDGEDTLVILVKKIPESAYLQGAEIWVDGFYGFTRLEYQVLEALLKAGNKVTVTLCLDREYLPEEKLPISSPFYSSALTLQKLIQKASGNGVPYETILLARGKTAPSGSNAILEYLKENLYRFPLKPYPASREERETTSLILAVAQERRHEVEAAARKIVRQVRDAGYRWRDIAVLTANLEDYRHLFTSVFEDYEIPFFLDQRRPADFHPLVEFIRSSVEVVTRGWRYDSVFRCLKTGFLFPAPSEKDTEPEWRKRVSHLENYVLARGIQGSLWLDKKPWIYSSEDALEEDLLPPGENKQTQDRGPVINEINETRRFLAAPLGDFQQEFKEAANVRGKTAALFRLLENISAEKRLEFWSREDLKKGSLEEARQHAQVYNGVIDMFEQLVELMGEMDLSARQFSQVLETGLDSLSLGLVPPSLDGVMVGDIERTRLEETCCVFILGANDGILPARLVEESILTEEERKDLEKAGIELAPSVRVRLLEQQFLIYMAFTRPSALLWVSYPRSDEEGQALMPSLLIAHLRDLFPFLQERFLQSGPVENNFLEALPYLVRPRQTLSLLAVQLSRWKEGLNIGSFWWDVYNWYARGEQLSELGTRILGGLFYRNAEPPINREISRKLYGEQWKTGISRLEMYRACPFSQFLSYGLRLRQRKLYRLESMDIGRFFHMALRNVILSIQEKEIDFSSLDEEECLLIVGEVVDELVPKLQKEILLSSNRYLHLALRLKSTVGHTVLKIVEHFRRSQFRPVGVEVPFGRGEILPSLELELGDGGRVEIMGRIDRIDLARDGEGRAYLRVIDYKSGDLKLHPAELYHGLSLQLLTYFDIALAASPKWLKEDILPAGIFYFRIHAPLVDAKNILTSEQLAEELLKRYRMVGRCLADPSVARLMDTGLEKGYSPVLPVGLSTKGDLYKNSNVFSQEQFDFFRRRIRFILQESVKEIAEGRVGIHPYQLGKQKACAYCIFKEVCQFDSTLGENNYYLLQKLDEETIWKLLQRGEEDEKQI